MRAEAERLIAEGRMPPLHEVLAAVEETRRKYRKRILEAIKPVRYLSSKCRNNLEDGKQKYS
jgi:hypothetical protein